MSDAVLLARTSEVATITFNRPESKNRLDAAMMTQLCDHLRAAANDPEIRVIVLTGSGSTFCAGADLAAAGLQASGPQLLVDVLTTLLDCPKPTIARVQGHVAGGGNGLVAACDIAIASDQAKFAFSEVRVGVAPAVISAVCLDVMHRRDAQELFITGERVDAQRARDAGLLTDVVAEQRLDARVDEYVQQCRAGGPLALAQVKELLRRVPAMERTAAFTWTAELSGQLFESEEAREGMTAFLEKRQPSWLSD